MKQPWWTRARSWTATWRSARTASSVRGCGSARTRIKSHAVIEGNTTIGQGNLIFQFATVGSAPQDLKYRGEESRLVIGDHNTIREFVSLNPGTTGGGMVTRVGSHNLLMMYCHIAHDCSLSG